METIVEIGQYTNNSPGDLRGHAVTKNSRERPLANALEILKE